MHCLALRSNVLPSSATRSPGHARRVDHAPPRMANWSANEPSRDCETLTHAVHINTPERLLDTRPFREPARCSSSDGKGGDADNSILLTSVAGEMVERPTVAGTSATRFAIRASLRLRP